MDRFDRQIAEFVATWEPYGWPPADQTLVEFGMTSRRFYECCVQILVEIHRDQQLDPGEKDLILTMKRSLMWHRGKPSRGQKDSTQFPSRPHKRNETA